MNGPHDLGGMMGFGPISLETDEPVFHADWEKRILGLTLAMGALGKWNIDMSRHARERMPAPEYLNSSYYQIWLGGLIKIIVEQGLVDAREIASGKSQQASVAKLKALKAQNVAHVLERGGPANRELTTGPQFKIGEKIRTRNMHPNGHTRLARYLRGHEGEIIRVHGAHVLPDSNAHGDGENPQWLYGVRFKARELWGRQVNTQDSVCADLWETYLERV